MIYTLLSYIISFLRPFYATVLINSIIVEYLSFDLRLQLFLATRVQGEFDTTSVS